MSGDYKQYNSPLANDPEVSSESGEDDFAAKIGYHSPSKPRRVLRVASLLLLVLLSIWGFVSLTTITYQRLPSARHHQRGCYCGTSSAEAKSMGCKYDSLAAAWLPEHCRDDELTAEFERSGDGPNGTWLYWKDTHHTIPITVEEIAYLGDTPGSRFHMDYSWHEVHCLFYWIKEHRFRSNGKTLDPRSDTEEHIRHCGMVWGRKATYGTGTISGVVFDTNSED